MKRKPYHKQSAKATAVSVATQDVGKAKNLPMPGPGIRVSVPLLHLPAYMELYGLQPTGWLEPNTLTVKRVQKQAMS